MAQAAMTGGATLFRTFPTSLSPLMEDALLQVELELPFLLRQAARGRLYGTFEQS